MQKNEVLSLPIKTDPVYERDILDANGELIATVYPHEASEDSVNVASEQAQSIVRSVNSHDVLVEALELALETGVAKYIEKQVKQALTLAKGGSHE